MLANPSSSASSGGNAGSENAAFSALRRRLSAKLSKASKLPMLPRISPFSRSVTKHAPFSARRGMSGVSGSLPPALNAALGIFIPLIVVNCIVLGRAEAFASKNGPIRSICDGLGMGLGFTLTLTMLGMLREFLSSGAVFGVKIITVWTTDFMLPAAAPGAFIIVGVILGIRNHLRRRAAIRAGKLYVPPEEIDCGNCHICTADKED